MEKLLRLINPWGEIRRLRQDLAWLQRHNEELVARADEAEEKAFHRASGHYYQRLRMEEERNKALLERMADISSLTVRPKYILNEAMQAALGIKPEKAV